MNLFSVSTPDCDTPGSSNSFYDMYNIFQVVDRGNNDIGTKVLANLATLYKNLYADFTKESITPTDPNNQNTQVDVLTKSSINNLFSSLATESGFLFQQIPHYLNINGSLPNKHDDEKLFDIVDHMFGTHTDTSLFGDTFNNDRDIKFGGPTGLPGYIFQLGTMASSPDEDKNQQNNYTNSFCLDLVMDSNNEVSVTAEEAPEEILKSNVTSFVVDFGKQNQQMFKSIQLDTAQFYDTEESIKTWVNLVNDTGTGLQTTNLFPILEKRSYTCNVVSLGNATIQPLSYFYLRNVPLFHGTYWITNVSHKITPNTMLTEFKGVRQPIATKGDTRKALLRLIKEKIKDIENANKEASKVQTEGLPDTEGTIKVLAGSNKPYRDFIQQVKDGTGYAQMDGKDILGAYIYSITRDNKMTAANYGMISYLYNIASVYVDSVDPNDVLPGMVKVAISNMKFTAEVGDTRYTTSNTLSLSHLLKNIGANFLQNDELGQYLDNLTELNYITKNHKIPATTKAWNIQATGSGGGFDKGGVETTLRSTAAIVGFSPDSVDLSQATLFLDPIEPQQKSNDVYRATNQIFSMYDIFHAYDPTNFIIDKINTEVTLEQVPDDKVSTLAAKKPRKYADVNKEAPFTNWFWYFNNDAVGGGEATDDVTTNQLVKFATLDSDGTFDDNKLATYLFGIGTDATSVKFKNIKEKVAGAKKGSYYQPSIFSGIKMYKSPQDVQWEGSAGDDVGMSFNGTMHWYDFDATTDSGSKENFEKFINGDVKSWYSTANEEYEKENKASETTTAEPIKVKYLGAYGYGSGDTTDNVAFFKFSSKLTLNSEQRKLIDLETSTSADTLVSQGGNVSGGEKRAAFCSSVKRVAEEEFAKWDNGSLKECGTDEARIKERLSTYWEAANTTLEAMGGRCNGQPWSGAFISYCVKNAGPTEFPYAGKHAVYITKARDNKNSGGSYSWNGYEASSKEAKVEVGDLICATRAEDKNVVWKDINTGTACHCDIVVGIDEQMRARTIGGNVSQSVYVTNYQLNDDYTIDLNDSGNAYTRGILKYQPAESSTTTASNDTKSTKISDAEKAENQVKVKNILKKAGLTKVQAAGVMGNIQKESGFNPTVKPFDDLNGYPSVGLIQWNAKYTPKGGTKDVNVVYKTIGTTVEEQMDYLINKYSDYKTYIKDTGSESSAWTAAYKFAKLVERCAGCITGLDEYKTNKYHPSQRSEYANDFYNRFNTPGDSLYWDGGGNVAATSNTSTAPKVVAIGDSLATGTIKGYSNIKGITSPQVLDQVGKHLSMDGGGGNLGGTSLINLLKATNTTFPDVKKLVLSIGANDMWKLSSGKEKETECINLIKKIFPKASLYILNGNYGWFGAGENLSDAQWETRINNYINVYKNSGFTVIGSVTKVNQHPAKGDALFNTFDATLKSLA